LVAVAPTVINKDVKSVVNFFSGWVQTDAVSVFYDYSVSSRVKKIAPSLILNTSCIIVIGTQLLAQDDSVT